EGKRALVEAHDGRSAAALAVVTVARRAVLAVQLLAERHLVGERRRCGGRGRCRRGLSRRLRGRRGGGFGGLGRGGPSTRDESQGEGRQRKRSDHARTSIPASSRDGGNGSPKK